MALRTTNRHTGLTLACAALIAGCACAGFATETVALAKPSPATTATAKAKPAQYGDPKRFEKDILAFEREYADGQTTRGAVICIGSSSMRGWHATIREDLAPLTVIPRGFGGSTMSDAAYYAERLVAPCAPRAVMLYEGDNDLAGGIEPQAVCAKFREFVANVRKVAPQARLYVLSIKPSPSRSKVWPKAQETNALLRQECAKDKTMAFIDVGAPMFDAAGNLREELFLGDKLHMTRKGYEVWRDAVKPVLLPAELPFEKAEKAADK